MSERRLRVLSIAHTAVSRDIGQLRYHPLAAMPDLDVTLVAPNRWREYGRSYSADTSAPQGMTLLAEPIVLPSLPGLKWYAHLYPRLHEVIARVDPDVIHLWEEPWSLVALQATMLRGNAALVLEVDQNILRRLPPPFEAIRRAVLRRTTVVLSRSPDATAVVRACGYTGPVRSIGYGVDQSAFFASADQNPAPLPDRPLKIGYVGRLVEGKGIDDALTAMTLAERPVELAIMGEGEYESQLRENITRAGLANKCSISGWAPLAKVGDFLRSLDVSLLLTRTAPRLREQFGRTIVESQSCGVPVIGSTCGAIPDVVGRGGWIIPERDPAALARLIDRIQQSPEEIKLRSQLGLANVSQRFTFDAVARDLANAWREAHQILHGAQTEAAE